MALFLTLLPFYLLGNIHCLGMCGPLVMMIGQNRYRHFYFLGRLLSFSLAGMLAGEAGAVLHVILKQYHIAEATSFIFGGMILWIGVCSLTGREAISLQSLTGKLGGVNRYLSSLMLKEKGWSTFLFGFFTVLLPCGQTLVVFSACALAADPYVGLFNGFAFALLTTPSLVFAMHLHKFLKTFKKHYHTILGSASIFVGTLALCRGLAELGWIPHLVLNPEAATRYHLIIF